MARIAGVVLPNKKRIEVALTYVLGIGRNVSRKVLTSVKIDYDKKTEELTENDEKKLREAIAKYLTEGDLRRKIQEDINRLQRIGTYRGQRHKRKLPVRGQRTKTNARTKRGKKVTMGSGKRKETKK
jgi:small subunit ribosomal protein S13